MAESLGDAGLVECLTRNQLGLEARLELELILVQILELSAAGRRAARPIVRTVRPAQNYVVRPVSQDVRQMPCPAVLCAELPGPGEVRCAPESLVRAARRGQEPRTDRKSTRLNSSHLVISYAVFCLK